MERKEPFKINNRKTHFDTFDKVKQTCIINFILLYRGELYIEREKKLRPYIGESLTVGAEPYQLQDMKMVCASNF